MSIRVILFLTILISTLFCSNDDAVCTPPAGTISAETIAQQNLPPATVAIKGSEHANFTGSWSLVKGNGGSFANAKQSETTFTGTPGQAYTLRWSLSGCNLFYKDIEVTIGCPTLQANAGFDQQNTLTTYTLNGNVQEGATGMWTIVSGTGGQFANATNHNTNFTGTAGTTYTLRWTLTNACGQTQFDEVIVSIVLPQTKFRISKVITPEFDVEIAYVYKNGKLDKEVRKFSGQTIETSFEYSPTGQLVKILHPQVTVIYTYLNEVVEKSETFLTNGSLLFTTTFTYTNNMITSSITDYVDAQPDIKSTYTYGTSSELLLVKNEQLNNPSIFTTFTRSYYTETALVKRPYTEFGPKLPENFSNLLIKSYDYVDTSNPNTNNSIQYTYEFDQLGRVSKLIAKYPLKPENNYTEILVYEIAN